MTLREDTESKEQFRRPDEEGHLYSHCRVSKKAFFSGDNSSYACTALAYSVSPPTAGALSMWMEHSSGGHTSCTQNRDCHDIGHHYA